MVPVRLQKILSRRGYGSRRDCEKIIASNRVQVNGHVAKLGDKADPEMDTITVDGHRISPGTNDKIYIAFNKPQNVLSEIKRTGKRKIVRDFIPLEEYLFLVGRLDYRSEGLILLTNDGPLANRLTHPRYEHEKEYHVLTKKPADKSQIEIWRRGVVLSNGYQTLPVRIEIMKSTSSSTWLRIVMREGKKRQIREVGNTIGVPVVRIVRSRIGTVSLGNLKPGEWRYLDEREINGLKSLSGLS